MRALILTALLALAACAHVPPPVPVDPDPPSPEPGPAATACERSCAKADELGGCNGAGGPDCVEGCERYEAMGGAFARNPECQAKAETCEQRDACRSGN